ncbi:MAG: hypothetical protein JXQ76_09575 [Campylobacterales bacterium]|nr:hypothetical protein [Campylobacterales bacterium]
MFKKLLIVACCVLLSGCISTGESDEALLTIPNINDSSKNDTPQDALNRHNAIRAEVFGGNDMAWDDTLAFGAQAYADYLASTGRFEHDSSGYGENLFAASYNTGYLDAINSWYSEKSSYNYANNSCNGVCGHYTQMVWKNSTKLGCGKATYTKGSYSGGTVVVCRYDPAGNYVGERPY